MGSSTIFYRTAKFPMGKILYSTLMSASNGFLLQTSTIFTYQRNASSVLSCEQLSTMLIFVATED